MAIAAKETKPEPKKIEIDRVAIGRLEKEKERLTDIMAHKPDRYLAIRAYENDIAMLNFQIQQIVDNAHGVR